MADSVEIDLIIKALSEGFEKVSGDLDKLGKSTETTKKGFEGAGEGADQFAKSSGSLSGILSKLAGAGLLAKIGQEALELGKASIQAAGDAAEMQSKFDVVFGESAPQAQQALKDLGEQVNRSAVELQGMAASIQDTFVPLGFARDEAAKLSVQLTQLAVDVGSFNNVADADVMRDFQSALVGNTETVRKYGIVITEANTKQKAYEMGITEVGAALTEQEKVQARLQLILEGTSDAQGDAIRTADSYANTQKGLEAATLDLKVALGELATTGLAGASQEVTVLVKNLTDLISWIGKVQAISDEHNRTVALSTATYEDYAAEVVRVAVVTGKLNEKQAEIVLATYKNADANTELSGTMQKLGADIGLLTEAERLQLQQVNALTAAYEAAGVTAYTWTEAQTKANEITVEWADNTFYANQALEMQADDMYLAYTTSEKFADRLQLVNDKAVALTEALHNAKPSIDEMRDALNQDISSPLDDFINDIEFFVASGGRDFVAEFENIQQKLADAMAAPGGDAFALQQAKEDAAALLVDIENVKVAIAEVSESIDFWKSASGLLNTALKSQAETESELNARQIELLYVTGQITEAQKAQYLAANEQIQKLEQLNKLLDAGYISWEQYLSIVADGKVTMEEMGDAVAEVAGPLLDANLASDTQMWNDMGESIGDVGNNAAQAVESFDLVKQKMLETGKGLEFVTQNAGPFQGAMETTNEVLGTTVVTAEQASLMVGNLASAAQAAAGNYNIHFNVTSTGQIPQLGSSADVTQKSGETAVGLASGADFIVPPGYPNDSYGPIYVQSGEHVQVTPPGQAQSGGGSSAPPIVQVFLDSQQIAAIVRVQQGQDYRQRTGGGYRP